MVFGGTKKKEKDKLAIDTKKNILLPAAAEGTNKKGVGQVSFAHTNSVCPTQAHKIISERKFSIATRHRHNDKE